LSGKECDDERRKRKREKEKAKRKMNESAVPMVMTVADKEWLAVIGGSLKAARAMGALYAMC
jgi:hypothetical protein